MAVVDKGTEGKGLTVAAPPPDELPDGEPEAPAPEAVRDDKGHFLPGAGTRALAVAAGRESGKEARERAQLTALLGRWQAPEDHDYLPYSQLAREWRDSHLSRMAETIGGGEVGPGPASVVSTAAIQLGASRWCADLGARTQDKEMMLAGSKLGNDSRQNLLAAHELCAKEAAGRAKALALRMPWQGEQVKPDPEISLTGKRGRPKKKRR